MDVSTYLGNAINNHLRGGAAWSQPASVWLSVHTADPGLTGASEVATAVAGAPAGAQYNRTQITFGASASKAIANTGQLQVTMPPAGGPFSISWMGVFDASTGGNFLFKVPILGTNTEALTTDSSDLFSTVAPHNLTTDDRVEVTVGNLGTTLPAGLVDGTIYYVLASGLTATAFKLATTSGGAAVSPADGAVIVRKLTIQSFAASNILQVAISALTFSL